MRKNFIILASAACFALGLSHSAYAAEPLKTSIGADLVSSYLWRGQKLDGASIQPTIGLEWGGLSLSAWGSATIPAFVQLMANPAANNMFMCLGISF